MVTSFCLSKRNERCSAYTNNAHSATRIPMSAMPGLPTHRESNDASHPMNPAVVRPVSTSPAWPERAHQCSKSWKLLKSSSNARPCACSTTCTDASTRSNTAAGERNPLSSCPGRWKPASSLPVSQSRRAANSEKGARPDGVATKTCGAHRTPRRRAPATATRASSQTRERSTRNCTAAVWWEWGHVAMLVARMLDGSHTNHD